ASDSSARGPPYTGSTGPRTPDRPAGFGRPSSAPPLPATDTPTPWSDAESLLPGDPRFDHRLEHFRSSPPSDVPSSPLLAGPTSRNCCRKEEPTFRSSRSCPPFTTPRPSLPLYFLRCALLPLILFAIRMIARKQPARRRNILPSLRKLHLANRCLIIPSTGWRAGDGGNFLDGNLVAASFGALDRHLGGIARLLVDLLIRRGLVADVQFLGRVGLEEEDARFFRDAKIFLVQDRAAKREALQVSRLTIRVGQREHALALGQSAKNQVRPHEQFLLQLRDLVVAILEHHEELVELRAVHAKFLARNFVAEVAGLA